MRLKPRHKRRILWTTIAILATALFAIIIVPPMIHLNSLKPKIQEFITKQTGTDAQIHGNINFSLLGKTTIIAHNISIPNGVISSCEFSVPLHSIFNISTANISGKITINGADLSVDKITPFELNTDIIIRNSKMKFLNKEYDILSAALSPERVDAIIKTDQHRYQITSIKNKFDIKNKENSLSISGTLFPNGTAIAHITINAQDINRWFEFERPKITARFPITADISWDGGYGIEFSNISANGATGNIILHPDGYRIIQLTNKNADYDMSFVLKDPDILKNASFNLDFYGKIKFMDKKFKHLYVNTVGSDKAIRINKITADDINISDGIIDKDGAHNLIVSFVEKGKTTTCEFNGTPNAWSCGKFSYDNKIFGNLNVDRNKFNANITSNEPIENLQTVIDATKRFGNNGTVNFNFKNMSGKIHLDNKKPTITYNFVVGKNLKWAKLDLQFLPEFMMNESGNFVWQNDTMIFIPNSKTWNLSIKDNHFYLSGDNFKKWFPRLDLQSLQNLSYIVSGNYKNGNISDLTIQIAQHKFVGSATKNSITLKSDFLNLDSFISPQFSDNFESLSFFVNAPLVIPFDLTTNISLSANTLIYNGQKYNNFVYSLKPNTQTFSITDSDRGNMLATITKNNIKYAIDIRLNKFVWDEKMLPNNMPLNISDSSITAEIKLQTYGKIAHDIINNINGTFDATFDGGVLYGFGFENFYASAKNINILNAEYALSNALNGGTTPIKQMRLIGTYDMGNIKTTIPLTLSMRHVDASGNFEIIDNKMSAKLNFVLRGTAPEPAPISVKIHDNNYREYSLAQIMTNFDPEYMQSFTKSHNKF